jgi:hypothetical protein
MIPREGRSDDWLDERNSEVTIISAFYDVLFLLESDIPNRKPFASRIVLFYDWQNK